MNRSQTMPICLENHITDRNINRFFEYLFLPKPLKCIRRNWSMVKVDTTFHQECHTVYYIIYVAVDNVKMSRALFGARLAHNARIEEIARWSCISANCHSEIIWLGARKSSSPYSGIVFLLVYSKFPAINLHKLNLSWIVDAYLWIGRIGGLL